MNLNDSFHVAAPIETTTEVLLSDAFNVEAELARRDTVVSTRFEPIARTADRVVFAMHSVEYDRTKRGTVNRSRTVPAVTRFEWSRPERSLRWRYDGVGSGLVRLSGSLDLEPEAGGTRVTHHVDVAANVPLVGKLIARIVGKVFAKGFPKQRDLLLERAIAPQLPLRHAA